MRTLLSLAALFVTLSPSVQAVAVGGMESDRSQLQVLAPTVAKYDAKKGKCMKGDVHGLNGPTPGPCSNFFSADLSHKNFWKDTYSYRPSRHKDPLRLRRDLRGSSFQGADIEEATFYDCELSGANFNYSKGGVARFPEATLTAASFIGATLGRPSFYYALLERAKFNGAQIPNANFQGATLWSADFSGADLSGASFYDAKVDEHTKFMGAKLQGVTLPGAIDVLKGLQNGRYSGAEFDEKTTLPVSRETAVKHGMIFKPTKNDGPSVASDCDEGMCRVPQPLEKSSAIHDSAAGKPAF